MMHGRNNIKKPWLCLNFLFPKRNKGIPHIKSLFTGLFNTTTSRVCCILTPIISRIHFQRRHASYRCARPLPVKAGTIPPPPNFASRSVIYKNPLGSFTCRKAGTWDILFYCPSEGRHTEDFSDDWKIQRLRLGLNPQTQVPVASMLTTRPLKPSFWRVSMVNTGVWGRA
jgi:hypothetical protein